MLIEQRCFTTKDGREVLLRNPMEADIPEILDYLTQSSGETDFLTILGKKSPILCRWWDELPEQAFLANFL